jgi:hypothetical protein
MYRTYGNWELQNILKVKNMTCTVKDDETRTSEKV